MWPPTDGMIPSSPSGKGYEDATCTSASDNFGSNADGIINCTDGQGVVFWVMHFPNTATLDTYVKDNFGSSPEVITWTRDDQDAGTRYGSADDEKTLAYLLTTSTTRNSRTTWSTPSGRTTPRRS